MRFYPKRHRHTCGIDLHARTMYLCILDEHGEVLLHKNVKATPEAFLKCIEPYRDDLVVGVECIFTWYWLADLCAAEGITFSLGHALYMKAIHGAKAKNDRLDAFKIAKLLAGGNFPVAYAYPPKMRSTRDLLRRRLHLVRKRGQLLAHIRNTTYQENMPAITTAIAYKSNREGLAETFTDPSVHKSMEVDIALIDHYDKLMHDLELFLVGQAKTHDAHAFYLLRSVPGIGKILALTILYEIHDISRFPRVQDFASYSRLVKCASESAGKRSGTSGAKIGNVHLKWAFSEAAVLFLRNNEPGKKLQTRLERKHGKGKSLSILAHKIGRCVYHMLQRNTVFDMERFMAA
jgi:transposase